MYYLRTLERSTNKYSRVKFSEVIGQENIKARLLKMVADEKVPHALLLNGAMGRGTLALAIAFASYLLGEREEGTEAHTQAMLAKFQHPDLHFIFPVIRPTGTPADKKITSDDFLPQWIELLLESPYFTFEEWLSRMRADTQQAIIPAAEGDIIHHKLSLKSSQGGYKVCVLWLPERMHESFANKMLKLLEEPWARTMFILVSEEAQELMETIRSRTQLIEVKRIDDESLRAALTEQREVSEDAVETVLRMAHGDLLKAIELLDSESEKREFHEFFVALMRLAYQRDIRSMKQWTDDIAKMGREKQRRLLKYFSEQIRENFMYNYSQRELVYMTKEEEAFSKNFARFINETNVLDFQQRVDNMIIAIGQNANAKIQFFDLALQTCALIRRK